IRERGVQPLSLGPGGGEDLVHVRKIRACNQAESRAGRVGFERVVKCQRVAAILKAREIADQCVVQGQFEDTHIIGVAHESSASRPFQGSSASVGSSTASLSWTRVAT